MAGEHGALRDRANDVRRMFVGARCANMCICSARTGFFSVLRADFGGNLRVGNNVQGAQSLQNEGKTRMSGAGDGGRARDVAGSHRGCSANVCG